MKNESRIHFFYPWFLEGLWSQDNVRLSYYRKTGRARLSGPTLKTLVSYRWRKYIKNKRKQGTSKLKIKILK